MKLLIIGGGPAGLAAAALLADAFPRARIDLVERRTAEQSHGYGITVRDHALQLLDLHTLLPARPLTGRRVQWGGTPLLTLPKPAIDTLVVPLARDDLVRALRRRCLERGVTLHWNTCWNPKDDAALAIYDLVIVADGAHSPMRGHRAERFGVRITHGRNHFAWYRASAPYPEMTILLSDNGLPAVAWAYGYAPDASSFIVEVGDAGLQCMRETGADARLLWDHFHVQVSPQSQDATAVWQRYPTIHCEVLHTGNIVLIGDAAHTMHFSQGFGTMFAFDDALTLTESLVTTATLAEGLARYQDIQTPKITELQAVARTSQTWSEDLVLALERGEQGRVHQLIAARWPGNTLGPAPMARSAPGHAATP